MKKFDKLRFSSLLDFVQTNSMETVYDHLGMDYANIPPRETEDTRSKKWAQFMRLIDWRRQPTLEEVRRLFNQINTHYAEQWMLRNVDAPPMAMLLDSNELMLYRQGKNIGLRKGEIEFGVRSYLPFNDPFRGYKWLRGMDRRHLEPALDAWCSAAGACIRHVDNAIVLAMALIGIHPFSDANGRAARLIFTWLCKRWNLEPLWMNEGSDGELLRVGQGVASTEFLMANLMIVMSHGNNVIDPGGNLSSENDQSSQMFSSFAETLHGLAKGDTAIFDRKEFIDLRCHLLSHQHFRKSSPRFECLSGVLA